MCLRLQVVVESIAGEMCRVGWTGLTVEPVLLNVSHG